MRRAVLVLALVAVPALGLTPEAGEFIEISKQLAPVQCEKRKLRRAIALAQAENRAADVRALRERFESLNRDRETARLEKRLAELEPRILETRGGTRFSEDLEALSLQQRKAFYACE